MNRSLIIPLVIMIRKSLVTHATPNMGSNWTSDQHMSYEQHYTLLLKNSRVEVARILLDNGARDEWGDLFEMYARDYIQENKIYVMFKKHGFSLQYNYETQSYEPGNITTTKEIQPANRGNFTSTIEVSTTTTTEPQTIPYRTVSFESSAEQQLNSPRSTSS